MAERGTSLRLQLHGSQGRATRLGTAVGSRPVRRHRKRSELEEEVTRPSGGRWRRVGNTLVAVADDEAKPLAGREGLPELDALAEETRFGPDKARAAAALRWFARYWSGAEVRIEIERVHRVGEGLTRVGFAANVSTTPDPDGISGPYVILAVRRGADPGIGGRMVRELELLEHLRSLELGFQVPRALGALWCGGHLFAVQSFIEGIPIELRAPRAGPISPWKTVAAIAAQIHRIDPQSLGSVISGPRTWCEHVEQVLPVLEGVDSAVGLAALDWARAHLPPEIPSAFLHGDLLGQNLRQPLEPGPIAVIDWERAGLGHPAYDLAIVTRGHRRPFQTEGGLQLLLEAYNAAGGARIEPVDVHLFELCLAAGWYHDALERPSSQSARHNLEIFAGILRRAQASA